VSPSSISSISRRRYSIGAPSAQLLDRISAAGAGGLIGRGLRLRRALRV
jgi:hypothetical protein